MRRGLVGFGAVLMLVLSGFARIGAQEATPELPVGIDPAECRVAPRDVSEVESLVPTPAMISSEDALATTAARESASPVLYPADPGEPIAEGVPAGVLATAQELIACMNAGDWLRVFGLYTDTLLNQPGLYVDDITKPAKALPPEKWSTLLDVLDPRRLPDGRVAVIVIYADPREQAPFDAVYAILVEVDGRWLFDDFPPYTSEPATPVAPVAAPAGDIPDPAECQVAPRPLAEVESMTARGTPGPDFTGDTRPVPTDLGTPADAATVKAVTATVREWLACANAGDILRMAALETDGLLTDPNISFPTDDLATANPLPPERRIVLRGVYEVRQLADGRVAAVVAIDDPTVPGAVEPYLLIFARDGDGWLFDDFLLPGIDEGEVEAEGSAVAPTVAAMPVEGLTPTVAP